MEGGRVVKGGIKTSWLVAPTPGASRLKLFSCSDDSKRGRRSSVAGVRCQAQALYLVSCLKCHAGVPADLSFQLLVSKGIERCSASKERLFHPALCLMEGGEARRLMDAAKAIRLCRRWKSGSEYGDFPHYETKLS